MVKLRSCFFQLNGIIHFLLEFYFFIYYTKSNKDRRAVMEGRSCNVVSIVGSLGVCGSGVLWNGDPGSKKRNGILLLLGLMGGYCQELQCVPGNLCYTAEEENKYITSSKGIPREVSSTK